MKKLIALCLALMLMLSTVACTTNDENSQPGNTQPSNRITPGDEPIQSSSSQNYLVAWADWSENDDLITTCLNFDKMSIGSIKHLPVFKCENQGDLEDFINQFKDRLDLTNGYDEVPSFEETTAEFRADFFDNNTLFLVYVSANSGSFRFSLDSYSVLDGTFRANIIQTNNTEEVTDNCAGWLIVIPVSNDQLQNVQKYDAVMK